MSPPKAACSPWWFPWREDLGPYSLPSVSVQVWMHMWAHTRVCVCVHAHACVCARAGRLPVRLSRECNLAGARFLPSCPVAPQRCRNM